MRVVAGLAGEGWVFGLGLRGGVGRRAEEDDGESADKMGSRGVGGAGDMSGVGKPVVEEDPEADVDADV